MVEIELGERAVSALYEENAGSIFHRINVVRGRAMDAVFARVDEVWTALESDTIAPSGGVWTTTTTK